VGRVDSARKSAGFGAAGDSQEGPKTGVLAERLRGERRRGFVGRADEIGVFMHLLAETSRSLLFISGQAGVGKSALLRHLQHLALDAGHPSTLIDASALPDDASRARQALRQQLRPLFESDAGSNRRRVLFVDAFEVEQKRGDWLVSEIATVSPRDLLLVIASRREPPHAFALDPAWQSLMMQCRLRPLDEAEARRLLELRGVSPEARDAIVEHSAGFPLALALGADVMRRRPQRGFTAAVLQDIHHALGRALGTDAVSPGQLLALDVCALALATTAELLDNVATRLGVSLHAEPQDAFTWLEDKSFVEWTPAGLRPHPLSRVGLRARLGRERPRRARAIGAVLRELSVSELEVGSRPESDLASLFYLDREVASIRHWTPPVEAPPQTIEPAQASDKPALVQLIRAGEGEAAASLAATYLERVGNNFEVVRDDGLTGLVHFIRFTSASDGQKLLAKDPLSAPLQRFMLEHPLAEGEESLLVRWFLDRDDYQAPTERVLALTGRLTQLVLSGKQLAYSFCVFRNPADWVPIWTDIELPWLELARVPLGEHHYSLIAFLWKRRSLRQVLLEAWQQPKPGKLEADESSPSLDELRLKVRERIGRLVPQLKLTPREREILEQLCLGDSLDEIARTLSIRPRTVKFHQENLLRKTGASSRAELFKKLL